MRRAWLINILAVTIATGNNLNEDLYRHEGFEFDHEEASFINTQATRKYDEYDRFHLSHAGGHSKLKTSKQLSKQQQDALSNWGEVNKAAVVAQLDKIYDESSSNVTELLVNYIKKEWPALEFAAISVDCNASDHATYVRQDLGGIIYQPEISLGIVTSRCIFGRAAMASASFVSTTMDIMPRASRRAYFLYFALRSSFINQ